MLPARLVAFPTHIETGQPSQFLRLMCGVSLAVPHHRHRSTFDLHRTIRVNPNNSKPTIDRLSEELEKLARQQYEAPAKATLHSDDG
jgi:hypothetical protein